MIRKIFSRNFPLTSEDFRKGIGIFGNECTPISKLAIVSAYKMHYDCTILDFHNLYRNLTDYAKEAKLIQLGKDGTINPFSTEGIHHSDYIELLLDAFSQSYRLSIEEIQFIREFLFDAYEQSKRSLRVSRIKASLEAFLEEAQEERRVRQKVFMIKRVLYPLFYGKTSEAVRGTNPISIESLFKGFTIIEIGSFSDYNFRCFLEYLILLKFYAYLLSQAKVSNVIALLDSSEFLFPNRYFMPYYSRIVNMAFRLNELKLLGTGFILNSSCPSEMDPLAFSLIQTVIIHQTWNKDEKFLKSMLQIDIHPSQLKPNHAILKREFEKEVKTISFSIPKWAASSIPFYETIKTTRKLLEDEFEEDAEKAYKLLKALTKASNVHKDSIPILLGLPKLEVEELIFELEAKHYIRSVLGPSEKPGFKAFYLKLTSKGKQAIEDFETKRLT